MHLGKLWISAALTAIAAGCTSTTPVAAVSHTRQTTTAEAKLAPATQPSLVLYDNFANPEISETLWRRDVHGGGEVSFDGGKATLDMTSPNAQKQARIVFPFTTTMSAVGGRFRITWDQQIVTDGPNGYASGFTVVSHGTPLCAAGQIGQANGGTNPPPYRFLVTKLDEPNYSSMDGGTDKHHFELQVTPGESTLKVYRYNAAFDAAPERYAASGKLLETIASPEGLEIPIPATAPLSLLFSNECATGDDHFSNYNNRGVISIQNVYTDIPVKARTPSEAVFQ